MIHQSESNMTKYSAERSISLVVLTAYLLLLHLPYQGLKIGYKYKITPHDDFGHIINYPKMHKHQPRLLFDTVQLLEIGLLGSTVLVWLEGEKRTGAALEEGTEEIGGILQQP